MTVRVYGRTEYAEPLTEIGAAEDEADIVAGFPAEWVELITFPERAIRWIVRDGVEVDAE